MVAIDEVSNLRVVDLKAELKALDLPTNGLKAALVDRLTDALKAKQDGGGEQPTEKQAQNSAPEAFAKDGHEAAAAEPSEAIAAEKPEAENTAAEPAASVAGGEGSVHDPAKAASNDSKPGESSTAKPEKKDLEAGQAADATETIQAEDPVAGKAVDGEGKQLTKEEPPITTAAVEKAAVAEPKEPVTSTKAGAASASAEKPAPVAEPAEASSKPSAQPEKPHTVEAATELAEEAAAKTATPQAEAATAEASATRPSADTATEAAEAAEPMLEDEAPELDFDVEPEEEDAGAASKPAAEAPPPKGSADTKSTGKRGREPIPGFKAPPKVDTGRRQDSDGVRPAKQQRVEGGTPGSAPSRRLSSHSNIPPATPEARAGAPVPPPNMKPTPALRIDNFVRPFTVPQVKELLSQQGATIRENSFWMPSIKTHCYVIYESAEQAETIRQATFNIQWPRDGKRLLPKFVTVAEAEAAITQQHTPATPRAASTPTASSKPSAAVITESPKALDARAVIREQRQQREARSVSKTQPETPAEEDLELDDLFRKTETWPQLYWLPVVKPKGVAGGKAANNLANGAA